MDMFGTTTQTLNLIYEYHYSFCEKLSQNPVSSAQNRIVTIYSYYGKVIESICPIYKVPCRCQDGNYISSSYADQSHNLHSV